MAKLKFKNKKANIIAIGGRSCYGVFLYRSDYDKALAYVHSEFRYCWFNDVREAYEWAILTFIKFNPDNYQEFEYYQLEDLLKKHIAFPYSERMNEYRGYNMRQNNFISG